MAKCFQKILTTITIMTMLDWASPAISAAEAARWTLVLHPKDFVIGNALSRLHTHRRWIAEFDENSGAFEVALRKQAASIPAPQCRMDYLILTIPNYYPENPKQASMRERRAVYDALVALQTKGEGSAKVDVEISDVIAREGRKGMELVACNLYLALPLSVQVSTQ